MSIFLGDKEVTMAYLGGLPINNASQTPFNDVVLYLDATNPASYPGSGSVWYDLSGFGNHATLYGSISESFQSPGYFEFSGSADDYAEVIQSPSLNSIGSQIDFTMITITYRNPADTSNQLGILGKMNTTTDEGFITYNNYRSLSPAGVQYRFFIDPNQPGRIPWFTSPAQNFGNNFTVFTIRRDSAEATNLFLYFNKTQGSNVTENRLFDNSENLTIGNPINNLYNIPYEGRIAAVLLYNRALTKTEIDNIVDYYDTILPIL